MTLAWKADDPQIPPDEIFLRRVPRKPAFTVPNLVTREIEVKPAALRFDDDGMSVHSADLLASKNFDREQLVDDWNARTVVEFPAAAVRAADGGIVRDPVPDEPGEPELGHSHALVRASVPRPPRNVRRAIQSSIAHQCRWVDEDPHKPAPT